MLRAGQYYPGMMFLGGIQRGKSLVVWQDRSGSILHAVGFALGKTGGRKQNSCLCRQFCMVSRAWDGMNRDVYRASKEES